MTVDLNCDMGEMPEATIDEALMRYVTSANVACGAHAGDPDTMVRTVRLALLSNVAVGAHPGFPDRANFGRMELPLSGVEIEQTVYEQIRSLGDVAARLGARLGHVKPHGALYNMAARNPAVAESIARAVARWNQDAVLIGLAGSVMLEVWQAAGLRVAAEAFADRSYEPDGSLRSRKFPDALITSPSLAGKQAVRLAREGLTQTICIHSDTLGSVDIAKEVVRQLRGEGIALKALSAIRAVSKIIQSSEDRSSKDDV